MWHQQQQQPDDDVFVSALADSKKGGRKGGSDKDSLTAAPPSPPAYMDTTEDLHDSMYGLALFGDTPVSTPPPFLVASLAERSLFSGRVGGGQPHHSDAAAAEELLSPPPLLPRMAVLQQHSPSSPPSAKDPQQAALLKSRPEAYLESRMRCGGAPLSATKHVLPIQQPSPTLTLHPAPGESPPWRGHQQQQHYSSASKVYPVTALRPPPQQRQHAWERRPLFAPVPSPQKQLLQISDPDQPQPKEDSDGGDIFESVDAGLPSPLMQQQQQQQQQSQSHNSSPPSLLTLLTTTPTTTATPRRRFSSASLQYNRHFSMTPHHHKSPQHGHQSDFSGAGGAVFPLPNFAAPRHQQQQQQPLRPSTIGRLTRSSFSPGYVWTGELPPRIYDSPTFSVKIFVGGVPWDADQETLLEAFMPYGHCQIEFPTAPRRTSSSTSPGTSAASASSSLTSMGSASPRGGFGAGFNNRFKGSAAHLQHHPNGLGGGSGGNMPTGYVYVIYENEQSVKRLLADCRNDIGPAGEWFFRLPTQRARSASGTLAVEFSSGDQQQIQHWRQVQIIPWVVSDAHFVADDSATLDHERTIFVGALHGMITAPALHAIMDQTFGPVVYAAVDIDRHNYPIGSGRVTFAHEASCRHAVSAQTLEVRTSKFAKRLQIDAFCPRLASTNGAMTGWQQQQQQQPAAAAPAHVRSAVPSSAPSLLARPTSMMVHHHQQQQSGAGGDAIATIPTTCPV